MSQTQVVMTWPGHQCLRGAMKSVNMALANHSTSESICFLPGFYLEHNPQTTSILLVVVCTGQQPSVYLPSG